MTVYIRTAASPEVLEEPIRREIQAVDPDLPVFGVRSLRSIISDSLAPRRFAMQMLGFFAATAMLLAAIGIYGVMAYFVSQRVREIGVRMALGRQRSDVLKLMVRQGMSLALIGVAVGLVAALGLTRLMSGLLFGVSAYDPLTLAMFTALLAGVALLANLRAGAGALRWSIPWSRCGTNRRPRSFLHQRVGEQVGLGGQVEGPLEIAVGRRLARLRQVGPYLHDHLFLVMRQVVRQTIQGLLGGFE